MATPPNWNWEGRVWAREAPPWALPLSRYSQGPRSAMPGSLCIFVVKGDMGSDGKSARGGEEWRFGQNPRLMNSGPPSPWPPRVLSTWVPAPGQGPEHRLQASCFSPALPTPPFSASSHQNHHEPQVFLHKPSCFWVILPGVCRWSLGTYLGSSKTGLGWRGRVYPRAAKYCLEGSFQTPCWQVTVAAVTNTMHLVALKQHRFTIVQWALAGRVLREPIFPFQPWWWPPFLAAWSPPLSAKPAPRFPFFSLASLWLWLPIPLTLERTFAVLLGHPDNPGWFPYLKGIWLGD